MVRTISAAEAARRFRDLLADVSTSHEPIVVEENGTRLAVLIAPEEFDTRARHAAEDWAIIERLRERNAHVDPDEVLRDVTEVVEAVRQERYEREQRDRS